MPRPDPPSSLGNPVPPFRRMLALSERLDAREGRVLDIAGRGDPLAVDLTGLRNVLVVKLDFIGDWVLTTPFLANLRKAAPNAFITAVVLDRVFDLAAACRFVDRVISVAAADRGPVRFAAVSVEALDASTLVELSVPSAGSYVPANGAVYPSGSWGDSLKLIAQMIKLGLGLRAVTLDLGGWDTHNGQGSAGAGTYFHDLVAQLSNGLAAFYLDLAGPGSENYTSKLTVAVMSEFGRRLRENTDSGTDHGHGSALFLLGAGVDLLQQHLIAPEIGQMPEHHCGVGQLQHLAVAHAMM
ncbi:MAG: DUF1501 domain-containing protein, partial [Bauldia sp.]